MEAYIIVICLPLPAAICPLPPVPPRLAPIVFSKGTRAGLRAQATCLVQEGDTPITLAWSKDGRPITGSGTAHHRHWYSPSPAQVMG